MREKLQQLMNAEHLTGSKLAEYLGIQPSSISHILGGRNKPSLDFVQKILQRYPRINPDWLLLDSEEMYRTQTSPVASEPEAQLPFAEISHAPEFSTKPSTSPTSTQQSEVLSPSEQTNADTSAITLANGMSVSQHGKVKRVILLFEDRTFESYELKR